MATFSDLLTNNTVEQDAKSDSAQEVSEVAYFEDNTEDWTLSDKYDSTDKYSIGSRYEDNNYSIVDDKKNVAVSPYQVNLTQEENSQYIPFEMARYYDGIDLMNMTLSVYFLNIENAEGESPVINVRYNDAQIRFGWVVPKEATLVAGKLRFEIHATGTSPLGGGYLFKTKPNDELEIEKSLQGNGNVIIDESWATSVLTDVKKAASDAQIAAANAENSAKSAQSALDEIDDKIVNVESAITENVLTSVNSDIANRYYTKVETDELISNIDLSEYYTKSETYSKEEIDAAIREVAPEGYATEQYVDSRIGEVGDGTVAEYVDNAVANVDVSSEIDPLKQSVEDINKDLADIHSAIDDLPATLSSDYYTKTQTDMLLSNKADSSDISGINSSIGKIESDVNSNTENISKLGTTVGELQSEVDGIDKSAQKTYDVAYNDASDPDVGENTFVFYEIENEGTDTEQKTVKQKFTIVGGSGGSSSSTTIKIDRITSSPLVVINGNKVIIEYNYSSVDSSGDDTGEGTATWKVGNSIVATSMALQGDNSFDITDYVSVGSQKVTLTVTDTTGALTTKYWTVQVVDVRLESSFDDTFTYPVGTVLFGYTPYGSIEKTVHFILDGEELDSVVISTSGIPMSYVLPSKNHGSHLLETFITAEVNGTVVETDHIYKDILYYDESSDIPVIGCSMTNIVAKQYDNTNIIYTVYDPNTETPKVELSIDGNVVSSLTLDSPTQTWQYKSSDVGSHILSINCRENIKTINVIIEELDINVEPVTANLAFDFNPSGYSNNDENRLWTDGTTSMTVSNNFDWVNGGYQLDDNGDQYFCIKAGTSAEIDYKLFADDAKKNGKEVKLVFKTTNVASSDATFLSCMDSTTGDNYIGLKMNVHDANIYGQAGSLFLPYSEEDIIEFEFNISKNTESIPMVMGYEDGVATAPLVYDDSYNFTQNTPKTITLGSPDCDLYIYRFKAYSASLTDSGILNNFIADARNAEEMISRYERNQIYNENGQLDPDTLAEKCPWLRVIKLDAPYFTNNKSDKVPNTTIQYIYKDGDPILDNWTAYNSMHSGQGTSSNNYGAAGRNLDLIMNKSGIEGVKPYIVLGDGSQMDKVSLTRNSVPNAYYNVKVNIASSENANNALLQRRYNTYNPYKRSFVREDETLIPKIKDTMEFENCVVFIKESDTDLTTHREFADNNWHFYAIGNIGDSKKSDSSRLTDPTDKYECVIEIMDVELPLSDFPADTMINAMEYKEDSTTGEKIYTWAKDENLGILYEKIDGEYVLTQDTTVDLSKTYYVDILEQDDFSEDYTYGWRYIWEDGTDEENAEVKNYCHQKWIEAYRFITTSTDEEFHAHLGDYFVVDSALYFYLFTARYLLIDSRSKNTFWHYGWCGEYDADGNKIRKWDLAFDYDNDSGLGINNYGDLAYRYGLEDTDVDENGIEVFRESDSTFFCRIKDLFSAELKSMYNTLESQGAWNGEGLINQFDEWQAQFPEELWRVDIQRKYVRTYNSSFISGSGNSQFLVDMCKGRKKYQRRQFERNQEKYMASKYQSSLAASDNIVIRCTSPSGDLVVPTNYRLKIIPYAYMYLNVKYGTNNPIQLRVEPNKEYEIPYTGSSVDILDIYSASFIKSIGDLSSCYPRTVDTSKAVKLKELIIGNESDGYDNPSLTTLTLGANYLLEKLNIENVSGLTQSLNLVALNNLKELYAHGSNIGGVTFAPGGNIEIAELPAINAMTMKNLVYLTTLDVADFSKLTTLIVENCNTVDLLEIFNAAQNLNRVRILGIDWTLDDTSLLKRIYNMYGIDGSGYNTEKSILTGSVRVPVIRQQELYEYQDAWKDLNISYDTLVEQFTVTFKNEDGTILDIQYVDKGGNAVDPITREDNPIPTPTKESTISHDFTYNGWDLGFTGIFSDRVITATYTNSLRKYTATYKSKGVTLQETSGLYGDNVPYGGDTPTYTFEESAYAYHLFTGWDKSGIIDGDKVINAVFDTCIYTDGYFDGKDISTLRPVEIYALTKLDKAGVLSIADYVESADHITISFGNDYNYNDIESTEIISEKTVFDGTNYIDSGIKLFDEDKDFVLAIDYKMSSANSTGKVLAQCYQANGSNGFKLLYNGGSKFTWGSTTSALGELNVRDMLVVRHVKGETGLHVYHSNLSGSDITYVEIERTKETAGNSTLVFGCEKADDGAYENNAMGEIYWAKVWYGDLGDSACKELVVWSHEKLTASVGGFKWYYLSDNSGSRCSLTLLGDHLLDRDRLVSNTTTNSGGWATTALNAFMNSRMYNAINIQWKQLIKQVKIASSIGNQSTEITESDCYLTIPALYSLTKSTASEVYYNEIGKSFSHISTASTRIRSYDGGDPAGYWTRTPNAKYSSYYCSIDENGEEYNFQYPNSPKGVLVEFSI